MNAKTEAEVETEVRGIVILQGKPTRPEPKLSYYMWCDISDAELDSTTKAA